MTAVLGGCRTAPPEGVHVWRLETTGRVDSTYAAAGRAEVRLHEGAHRTASIAAIPGGRVVLSLHAGAAGGVDRGRAAIVRLRDDGAPEPGFGADGVAPLPATLASPASFAVTADGSLVAAAVGADGAALVVVRLRGDGAADPAFGAAGVVRIPAVGPVANVDAVAAAAGGAILLAARGRGDGGTLLRLRPDGSVDDGFGESGALPLAWAAGTHHPRIHLIALPDGGVIVATASAPGWTLARYDSAGAPDAGFGDGGMVRVDWGELNQNLAALLRRQDGRLLLVGEAEGEVAVAAFAADGAPDPSFGSGGRLRAAVPGDRVGWMDVGGAVLLPGGSLMVAVNRRFTTARPRASPVILGFTERGAPDTVLGPAGVAEPFAGTGERFATIGGMTYSQGRLIVLDPRP